ncbi:MAG: site-specific integrase [Phycisphaeraceae bacterium]
MPRLTQRIPSYRLHKASGQAVVSLNGKDIYLGKHDSDASRKNYDKVIAEWLANHKLPPASSRTGARTVDSLIDVHQLFVAYYDYAQVYYLKDGKKTGEVANIEHAARPLNELFGSMFVIDFRPTHLKAVRQKMIEANLCRKTVNNRINRIRRLFKWGVENDMVPPDVLHALQAVAPLRRGRCGVREGAPVRPVPEATINACMPFLPKMVQAMIRVQEYTGMRPGELVIMRTRDLDTTGKVWIYQPESHKTDHYGHERHVYIGARAQEFLKPYLLTDLEAYIFSPRLAQEERWATCKNHRRQVNLDRKTKRKLGNRYTSMTYLRAIYYACEQAWPAPEPLCRIKKDDGKLESYVEWNERLKKEKLTDQLRQWRSEHRWHPHQLRHNAATYLRKQFGVEAARVVLGHRSAAVTEIYAEMDKAKAAKIMEQVG